MSVDARAVGTDGAASGPTVRTIADLARLAGVTAGTVSRALSDTGMLSKHTRERIKALAREHGFRPNAMARNLRFQRTGAIGVVIPHADDRHQHMADPFIMALVGHVANQLSEHGYDLLLSRATRTSTQRIEELVDTGRVDGLILLGQSDKVAAIDALAARYRPMVVWGAGGLGAHCTVGTDNRAGGRIAADHVLAQGARTMLFFGDTSTPEIAMRLDGVNDAVAAAGGHVRVETLTCELTFDTCHAVFSQHVADGAKLPDAIIAASDVAALAVLQVLNAAGIAVPDTVRVVGYDDLPFTGQTVPPLTTVRQDIVVGARHLVDLVLKRVAGQQTDSVVMTPELIVRASA